MNLYKKICVASTLVGLTCGVAQAQSVASDPVYIQRISLPAGSDTYMSIPVDPVALYQGAITEVQGDTISFGADAQWAESVLAGEQAFLLVVLSGELEGASFGIIGNGSNAVQVDAGNYDLSELAAGDLAKVQRAWTPADISALAMLPEGSQIMLYGQDTATGELDIEVLSLYGAEYGWFDTSFEPAGTLPLYRDEGFVVRVPAQVESAECVLIGQVPMVAHRSAFALSEHADATDCVFGITATGAARLNDLGLEGEAQLFVYDNAEVALNKQPSALYTYYEGYGWFDQSFAPVADSVSLQPGVAYHLKLYAQGGPVVSEIFWLPDYLQ